MIILDTTLYAYRLPLKRPLRMMGRTLSERRGYLLALRDESDHCGWGEIAPFPGIHEESLPDVVRQLRFLKRFLPGQNIRESTSLPFSWQPAADLKLTEMFPSVRYGLDMAIVNVVADRWGISPAALFSKTPRRFVSVNALLTADVKQAVDSLDRLTGEGYRTIKVKVGRKPIDEDIALVRELQQKLPDDVQLRLDANRAWTYETAVRFAREVDLAALEYIEEPLRDPAKLAALHAETGLPVALDESLKDIDPQNFSPVPGICAVIIKPEALGAISDTLTLTRKMAEADIKVVISCAFYSGIGLRMAAALAAAVNRSDVPAGLDTWRWLGEDLIAPPFHVTGGRLDLRKLNSKSRHVRQEQLTHIS